MRSLKRMVLLFCVVVLFSGCASQYQSTQTGEPMSVFWFPLDAANNALIEMSGLYTFGMGVVEYSGEKFQDMTENLGDISESL